MPKYVNASGLEYFKNKCDEEYGGGSSVTPASLGIDTYIVSARTSGNWRVHGYEDGSLIAFGNVTASYGTGTAWMGGYHHQSIGSISLPSEIYDASTITITGNVMSANLNMICGIALSSDNSSFSFYVFNGSANGSTTALRWGFIVYARM